MPAGILPAWMYDKTEDETLVTPGGAEEAGVDWDVLVTEDWRAWEGKGWRLEQVIPGLEGIGRGRKGPVEVKTGEKLGVLTRHT